jgi:hypothetical protein
MTAPGAPVPPTRASHGVGRWTRVAVIALLAALAVLVHHETSAVPMAISADGTACDGMACGGTAMQHCSTASLEIVKLAPPAQSPVPQGRAAHDVLTSRAKAAGTTGRAPPDLSVLSQLRI